MKILEISGHSSATKFRSVCDCGAVRTPKNSTALCVALLAAFAFAGLGCKPAHAQQANSSAPVVVEPGAPGKPSKTLPPSTHAVLQPPSEADVEFMQGMIIHHQQAVVMTSWIPTHTENKDVRLLGARISRSQADEIRMMQRWLAARGEPISGEMPGMPGMTKSGGSMLMPGMLTPQQMTALDKAKGAEFDKLFLTGMIQHHQGAVDMVKDLFGSAGAGQDADLFDFATDVDTSQRAEIRIMQSLLAKEFPKEK
ncbi:MAG TPA: DUF305 domain-containing protein [Verrucomicrobiae bacterium]|nr:DUF305 domain-containing protein [Verrucomicrobiae bacterium]